MNTTFRKMYTPEEIKAIAGGGGAGLEVIEITDVPTTSTSGTLNEAQMAIVNSDTPSCVKFNNEYYYKNDDNHAEGITVYTHTGNTEADGGATIKYFSITLATAAWTLTTQNVSGKLYMHILNFSQTGALIINNQIQNIKIYIICNSPTIFNSSNDYLPLIVKNQKVNDFIYLPCSYSSAYGIEQKSIINSFEIFTYNSDYQANIQYRYSIKYFNIDSLNNRVQKAESSLSSLYFQKDKSIVIPLG